MGRFTKPEHITLFAAAAALAVRAFRVPKDDQVHAPGKKHRGRPDQQPAPSTTTPKGAANQPWVRTSHSDSQKRRFRR